MDRRLLFSVAMQLTAILAIGTTYFPTMGPPRAR
jgi:hypothetical protein